ncbi:MAG TPA: efflux RND transporter permease subunit [Bacteroidales bacterium]|nr:efflux RND transporter permease subunit [Bacteroidales bacterium]
MLNRIIGFSLNNRLIIISGALLLFLTGTWIALQMEIDIFPELSAPTVVVLTEANGMATEEVEQLVTFPIETAVNGATAVRRVRSNTSMGFSVVYVEFDWGKDIYKARQNVAERLVQATGKLPEGVSTPVIAPQTSVLGEMMIIALTSDSLSSMDLRTMADWTVTPRLLAVGGVAQVNVIGGESKEYQVLADPYKMNFHNVTLAELIETCQGNNVNTRGGFINQYGNKYIIRGIARTNKIEELSNSIVKVSGNALVRLRDVADIKIGASPALGTASYRAKDAVLMTITKQPDANTVSLSEKIENEIKKISESTGSSVKFHTDIYNQASFINTSVRNVMDALVEGGIFVVIILFLFLFNIRTTLISLLAIPLSLLVTIITLRFLGITINTMSLGGMAIAIGSLVDDAIIDVENVYKNLRRNVLLPKEKREEKISVIYNASKEIRSSIWNATLIIIITFLPLFLLGDLEGRMLKPLGISFIVSLFASLIVAITVTPVLSSYFLTDEKRLLKAVSGSWTERTLSRIYTKALQSTLKRNVALVGAVAVVFAASLLLLTTAGSSFLPAFNEGALTINVSLMPGVSLEESSKAGIEAQKILMGIPEIRSVAARTGRSELSEHSFGENVTEIEAPFELEDRSRAEFFFDVRSRLRSIAGANIEVGQPVSHRMDNMLSGTRANIAIKIFGDDLNDLYKIAVQVRNEISGIPGIGDLNVEQLVESPEIKIKARREMMVRYGIDINSFNSFVSYALGGETVSDVYEDVMRFPMVLRYNDESRNSIDAIRNSMIDTQDGKKVPLSFIADVVSSSGPNSISRENVKRKIVISVNVADRDVGSVVKDIREKVARNVNLPENYYIEYGGQFESAANATRSLVLASLIAVLIIFVILYYEFRDSALAGIILLNLPLALIGGIFAVKASSNIISIPVIIGFITLFGIATRNGILLVSKYKQLRKDGRSLTESIIIGSVDRLNPILMTALTAALALIPLAMGGNKPGNEIQSPMAIVILGGLLSSTILNIFVIPSVYLLIERRKEK